jgi:PBP1b-binding outer membrane lipoprotein LpoB
MKKLIMLLIAGALVLASCSEGTSKTKYVYKKAPKEGVAAKLVISLLLIKS